MEQNSTLLPETGTEQQKACISCGNPDILKGYPNALCAECREKYIKYPIPLWVKAFGGAVALLVIILLFNLPKTFIPAVEYAKGVKAEDAKKYLTEQKEMQNVVKATPGFYQAKAHLLIAAFYNDDVATLAEMAKELANINFDDDDLLAKVNRVLDYAATCLPGDSLNKLGEQYPDSTGGIPGPVFEQFITKYPDNLYAKVAYASRLTDKKEYLKSDSLLQAVLEKDAAYIPALQEEAPLKRLMNDTKAALEYCDRILSINKESVYATAAKARILIKAGNKTEGLSLAKNACDMAPADPYANNTLILAYHFNSMPKERDALIEKTRQSKEPALANSLQYSLDVINNKEDF